MAVDYSTTALLTAIKRKCQIPTGDTKLSDTNLLSIADEEMRSLVIPQLLTVREDYFVEQGTLSYTANDRTVILPPPMNASTIVSVSIRKSDGSVYSLPRVTTDTIDAVATQTASTPTSYALQGETLYLLPTPTDTSATLLIRFERMPGRLVAVSTTQQGIATSYAAPTFQWVPSTSPTFDTSEFVSAFRNAPPFCSPWGYAQVTNSTGMALSIGTPLWGSPSDTYFASGGGQPYYDYICRWNESPVVPLPEAWHAVNLYAACSAVAREYGDSTLADYMRAETDARIAQMVQTASNRVRKQPLKAFDRQSPLRRGVFGQTRWNP